MNPLDLVERDLVGQAVAELRGPGRGMPGYLGGYLQAAAGPQVLGDTGAPEAVRTDLSGQTGDLGTALDHLQGIRPGQRPAGELVTPEDAGGPKQRAFGIGGQPARSTYSSIQAWAVW